MVGIVGLGQIDRGWTLQEYLERIAAGEDLDPGREVEGSEPTSDRTEFTDERVEILDALDRQFQAIEPKKIIETAVDSFDRMMSNLIGSFIPSVKTVSHE